jgi:ribonuclease HII
MIRRPTFRLERELKALGYRAIVGVDEAGCGALAGPVVAGAVILPLDSRIGRLHDSKLLSARRREEVYEQVVVRSNAWAAGIVSVEEIFEIGIRPATFLAMRRAIEGLPDADYLLVDAWTIPGINIKQRGIIKGDRLVKSIAAGSIIAKVTRDRIMKAMHKEFPAYGFHEHKGYGTRKHRAMISENGPSRFHRLNYKTFRQ